MLEGWAGAQVDWWEGSVGRDIILVELVLRIQVHDLSELIKGLKCLGLYSHHVVLELLDHRKDIFSHWPIFEVLLDFSSDKE